MAQIDPSDIGLATYSDVGDVANLKTDAKEVVAAINEVLSGSGGGGFTGEQMYMEGENNVVLGTGNVVFGSHNRIIGNGNVVIGDGHIIIGSDKNITVGLEDVSFEAYDIPLKRVYFFLHPESTGVYAEAGDRVIADLRQSWTDSEWSDYIEVGTGKYLTTVTEVNFEEGYITLADIPLSGSPPDSVHVIPDYSSISSFYILREEYKLNGGGSVTMGGLSSGEDSFSANYGNASGPRSAAMNNSGAKGMNSFSCNNSAAAGPSSFAANSASAYQQYAAALNNSSCHGYHSASFNAGRTAGKAIKCTAMSCAAKTLTAASGENVAGLAGNKVLIRYKNNSNTILYTEAAVAGVSGQTIYLSSDTVLGSGTYGEALISDGYVFRIEQSNGHNLAAGFGMAGGAYCQAHGLYTIAAHAGAAVFGKYGASAEEYSWNLANGASLAVQGLAVKILQSGNIHADGTLSSPCADYSEMFEWADGNPNGEDRAGYFVKLAGDKISFAEEFDTPLGVVSANPAIIGDSGEMRWQGKFLTDDFGRVLYHDVPVPAITDEKGTVLEEEHYARQPVLNPDWDASKEYIPRLKRPEWAAVGVLGKLIVFDDGMLRSGDVCRVGAGGIAVKSVNNGYQVLRRISQDKVLIWFR